MIFLTLLSHTQTHTEIESQVFPHCSVPHLSCVFADVEHEVRCLRKWVREMEGRLQPLDFRAGMHWKFSELEQKAKEYLVSSAWHLLLRVGQEKRKQEKNERQSPPYC